MVNAKNSFKLLTLGAIMSAALYATFLSSPQGAEMMAASKCGGSAKCGGKSTCLGSAKKKAGMKAKCGSK